MNRFEKAVESVITSGDQIRRLGKVVDVLRDCASAYHDIINFLQTDFRTATDVFLNSWNEKMSTKAAALVSFQKLVMLLVTQLPEDERLGLCDYFFLSLKAVEAQVDQIAGRR